jgi:hypothetical protein
MEISREQIIFILVSLAIGFSIGYFIPQAKITSLYEEIAIAQNMIEEKDIDIEQLQSQSVIDESEINKLNKNIQENESEIEELNIIITKLEEDFRAIEKDHNDLTKLYNSLYFQKTAYLTQDFSDYMEYDSDDRISVDKSRISWQLMDRSRSRRVVNKFEEESIRDFTYLLDFRLEEIDPGDLDDRIILEFWSLSDKDDRDEYTDYIFLAAQQNGINPNKYNIVFIQKDKTELIFSYIQTEFLYAEVTYYAKITRSDNLCHLQIYSDPERNEIILDTGILVGSDAKYTYLALARTEHHTGDFFDKSSGYVENLRIKTI